MRSLPPKPVEKVCPVLLRLRATGPDILVFSHPVAGVQLVKGTRLSDEPVTAGALRELAEESGITGALVIAGLGSSTGIVPGQLWHFVHVAAESLPDRWSFWTADDGGRDFAFFWWPLSEEPGRDWHESFVRALKHIRLARF